VTAEATEFKLNVSQILLQDVQFRHVGSFLERDPKTPIPQTPAGIEIELQQAAEAEKPAALVRLRVTSDVPEAPYSYTVTYLVVLTYEGPVPKDFDRRLIVTGATMAMPFVREVVANLSSRGRFGATWLSPVNFSKIVSDEINKGDTAQASATTRPDSPAE
jgi:preprotein translocase subunit SecB